MFRAIDSGETPQPGRILAGSFTPPIVVDPFASGIADPIWRTLEDFGADGTTAKNQSALVAFAAAALATPGLVLYLDRMFDVTGNVTIPADTSILSFNEACGFQQTVGNTAVLLVAGERCLFRGITFRGTGRVAGGAGQAGIVTLGVEVCDLEFIRGEDLGGPPIKVSGVTANHQGPTITSPTAESCGWGFLETGGGEYATISNPHYHACTIGVEIGPNVSIVGGEITQCFDAGVDIVAGGNNAHGVISGTMINHNATTDTIRVGAITNGFDFVACKVFDGTIRLTGSKGVSFRACTLDPAAYVFDGSTGTVIDGEFPGGFANVVTDNANGNASATFWASTCRRLDGTIPTWAAVRQQLALTFTADADQALTKQQSEAATIVIGAGVLTATHKLTSTKAALAGMATVLLLNNNAQSVQFAWAAGTAVSVPPLTEMLIGCTDGVNAANLTPSSRTAQVVYDRNAAPVVANDAVAHTIITLPAIDVGANESLLIDADISWGTNGGAVPGTAQLDILIDGVIPNADCTSYVDFPAGLNDQNRNVVVVKPAAGNRVVSMQLTGSVAGPITVQTRGGKLAVRRVLA